MERQEKKTRVGRSRWAFTLVELLVVITIIGMLMALLMPAISAAREQARRATCLNNEKQLALAMLAYEGARGTFPGWRNAVVGNSSPCSWLTMLLPNLERSDLWTLVKSNGTYTGTSLKLLICPSDPPPTLSGVGPSSYIANALVLRDQYEYSLTPSTSAALAPQTKDYISSNDGTSSTLMLGENTEQPPSFAASNTAIAKAHNWYDCDKAQYSSFQIMQTFGFPLTTATAPSPPYPASTPFYAPALTGFTAIYGTAYAANGTQFGQYGNNAMTANINSAHSGGANVAFFDGHAQFMRDDVGMNSATGTATYTAAYPNSSSNPLTIYQVLVTPEGSKNGTEPAADEGQWSPP